ncbi:MAG: ComEA family DNA-binding protein, partial [Flavobacteriales bacterium]
MRFCFVLLLLLFLTPAHAQVGEETRKAQIIEQTIELIGESLGQEDIDLTTVFDQLSYYYDNPINLNKTSREELQELYLLSEIQITNLLMHIERNGKFLSIYELQAVPGFDLQIIRAILPFVKIADRFDAPHADWKTLMRDGQNELFLRWTRTLEPQAGFAPISDSLLALKPNSRYLGSPDRLYMRYRYRFGNKISFGITGEKDPGEEFFKGTQKNGFDFYSAHFLIRDIGPLKSLAIGDYQVSFGQGLTFATGLALGKTANSLNVKRTSTAIRPYTSVDENQFMRGAAATMKFGKMEFTGFVSRNRVDANRILVEDTSQVNDEGFVVSSLQTSGIHATPAELEDKGALLLSHYGGHAAWKTKRTNIGATAVYSTLSTELKKNITYLNQFDFTGKSNLVTGLDFNHIWRNFNFFGEFSRSVNGGMAMQSGILASLDPKFSLVLLYRNYQKNYQSLFAN